MRVFGALVAACALVSLLIFVWVITWTFVPSETLHIHDRNDHGDAIQGLYSQLDCHNQPGKKPYYVDVDDKQYFLMCTSLYGEDIEFHKQRKIDTAIEVFFYPGVTDVAGSLHVQVPHVNDGTVLVCFKHVGERLLDCLYRNDDSGQVVIKHVMPDSEDL